MGLKKRLTGSVLPVSKQVNPDLLDWLLRREWHPLPNGSGYEKIGVRDKIKKYQHLIFTENQS